MSTFNKGDKVRVAADAKTSCDCDVYFSGVEVEATVIQRDAEDVLVQDSKGHSQYVASEYLTLIEEPDVVQYRYYASRFGVTAYYRVEKVEGEDKYLVNVVHTHSQELSETVWWGEDNIKATEPASDREEWIEQCIKEGKVIPHISEFEVGQLWHNIINEMHYEVIKVDDSGVLFTANKLNDHSYRPIPTYRASHDLSNFEPADAQSVSEWFKGPEISSETQEALGEEDASKSVDSVQDILADITKALDVGVQMVSAEDSPSVSIRALREAYGYLEDVSYLDIDKLIELAKRLS